MEGGAASLALASGTAACFYSIINMAQQGDNIVSAQNLYGGTFTQVKKDEKELAFFDDGVEEAKENKRVDRLPLLTH